MISIFVSSFFMNCIIMFIELIFVNLMIFITIFHNTWQNRKKSFLTKSDIFESICVHNSNPDLISIYTTRSTKSMEFLKNISIQFDRIIFERLEQSNILLIITKRLEIDSLMILINSIWSIFNPYSLRRFIADNMSCNDVHISCPMLIRNWDLNSNITPFSTKNCLSIEDCSIIWCMTWMKLIRTFLL